MTANSISNDPSHISDNAIEQSEDILNRTTDGPDRIERRCEISIFGNTATGSES